MSWICNRFFWSVSAYVCVCERVCSSLQQRCLPGKSANYNIKAVSTVTFLHLLCMLLHSIKKGQRWTWVPCKKLLVFILCWLFVQLDFITPVHKHMTYHACDFVLGVAFAYTHMTWITTCTECWISAEQMWKTIFSPSSSLCGNPMLTVTVWQQLIWIYLFSYIIKVWPLSVSQCNNNNNSNNNN